ncbi:MAG: xanthine dehydrogenase family protein molybdopterin-binding subunit [Salinarimonas sp.]|nr:xanthine dehydrogenase family protein molybdopterin-binding subunit [Salinarimonas sp.]
MLFRPLRRPSRRALLQGAAALGGALVIGVAAGLAPRRAGASAHAPEFDPPARPDAFIRIDEDDTVTVLIKHLDMGQGVATGLTTIVADELDASWEQMAFAFAPADHRLYNNLNFGPMQGTGASTAVPNSWMQLRKAGAAARAMLIGAAAEEWGVPAGNVRITDGRIRHEASGREAGFGAFAAAAAAREIPADPILKTRADFVHIGRHRPRLDGPEKARGEAIYSLDIRRPGQLTAMVAHPPRFGARLSGYDDSAAREVPGVVDVVAIPTGVAVVARDTWSAMKGREALDVSWDETRAERRSSADLRAEFHALGLEPGRRAAFRGDADAGMRNSVRMIEAAYDFPYLAHAAMEPMNGVIERREDGGYEAWGAFQMQTLDQAVIARVMGVTAARVKLNTLYAGGSFGRRASTTSDWIAEAAEILKATGERAPIHLVWSREDDMRAGYYRPMVHHRVLVGLGPDNLPRSWVQRIVGKPIMAGSAFEAMDFSGVEHQTVEGAADPIYAFENFRLEIHNTREQVPVLWWRSVGHTHTAQVSETMVDELAAVAGADPVAYRLQWLFVSPRDATVLRLATHKAGWGTELPARPGVRRGRGVAVHRSFGSHVAMVAEVAVEEDRLTVERIVAAVDCGIVINPDNVRAQVEGAIGFALSSVLRNAISLDEGMVREGNFDTFEPTRLSEMPRVEVHLVESDAPPTGMGEPGVPPLAPAICNAIHDATGLRVRSLPIDLSRLRQS